MSATRKDFPWAHSHPVAGDLRTGVQALKDATPRGVLLGSAKLAMALDQLDLIGPRATRGRPCVHRGRAPLYCAGPARRRGWLAVLT